jgi:hypothetical protein
MREIAATPPTAPPTMTSVFELLFGMGEEVGFTAEEDSPKSDDVAPLRVLGGVETVVPERPSIAPGACSGKPRKPAVGVRH